MLYHYTTLGYVVLGYSSLRHFFTLFRPKYLTDYTNVEFNINCYMENLGTFIIFGFKLTVNRTNTIKDDLNLHLVYISHMKKLLLLRYYYYYYIDTLVVINLNPMIAKIAKFKGLRSKGR